MIEITAQLIQAPHGGTGCVRCDHMNVRCCGSAGGAGMTEIERKMEKLNEYWQKFERSEFIDPGVRPIIAELDILLSFKITMSCSPLSPALLSAS